MPCAVTSRNSYFCSEDELKVFCREKLGWVGTGSGSSIKCDDMGASTATGEDSEEEETEEQWNLIAIHRASDIRDGKYKCTGCRRLVACSVWTKMGGSFDDQWHCCVDCQSSHFDLEGKAFPTVKSGDLPSSLDAITDSHRTIIAEMCSTKFRPDQILRDLPTKDVATSAKMPSSASSSRSSPKTPPRRATSAREESKRGKTPKKQSAARSNKAKKSGGNTTKKQVAKTSGKNQKSTRASNKAKKAGGNTTKKQVAKTSGKNQKSTRAKKATSTSTLADTKTLGREKLDRASSSSTNATSSGQTNATGTWSEQRNEGPITSEERYRRLSALIKPDMDPSLVWKTLNFHGWTCKSGKGLVSYYFVCSKYADESLQFILKNATHGDEYFCSEDEVREFCREKLGWVGSGGSSDNNRKSRDRRLPSRHGRACPHQKIPSGSSAVETTPAMGKKRAFSPEAQQVSHANAKRHAIEYNRHAVATGAPQELRFTTDAEVQSSTPAIKAPSEATFQNVLQVLASPTEDDSSNDIFEETETAHPLVDGEEAGDTIPQNEDVSAYDSDTTVPKSMPKPVPDEHFM